MILVERGGHGDCAWNSLAVGRAHLSTRKDIAGLVAEASALGKSLRALVRHHARKPEHAAQ
eukprot:6238831-Alexandrium_andersonii.AAC.1